MRPQRLPELLCQDAGQGAAGGQRQAAAVPGVPRGDGGAARPSGQPAEDLRAATLRRRVLRAMELERRVDSTDLRSHRIKAASQRAAPHADPCVQALNSHKLHRHDIVRRHLEPLDALRQTRRARIAREIVEVYELVSNNLKLIAPVLVVDEPLDI